MMDCTKHKAAILGKECWWLQIFDAKCHPNTGTVFGRSIDIKHLLY